MTAPTPVTGRTPRAARSDGTSRRPEGTPRRRGRTDEAPLPTGQEKVAVVRDMFDVIAPRYDLVNRLMTFGLDVAWRQRTVTALGLGSGSVVLDLACGTGDLCRMLAQRGLRPVGLDLSEGMLRAHRSPAPVVLGDGAGLPLADGAVDGVTCGFALRNFADLGAVAAEMARVVRPGGRIALLEVGEPASPLLRTGQRLWMGRGVPALGALLSDASAYRYLPRSVAYLPSPVELRRLLVEAGFSTVNRRPLSGGIAQLIVATRAGRPDDDGARDGGETT
jgi:demethylmenaquinone methyltransferase/2-methoxy-6-polyprenyl-1,4-benzoquinol methylase